MDTRRANTRGLYPVQFLLSHKGATTTIGTGIAIRPEHWIGDVSLERKDKQMDEVLEMLRREIKKGEDVASRYHAASRAATE